MVSPDPPAPAISITDAARDAIEHTRRNLFPIRVEKWLVLGFVALLALSLAAIVPAIDHVLPTGLALPAAQLAAGVGTSVDTSALATSVAGSIVLVGACAAGAVVAFRSREL